MNIYDPDVHYIALQAPRAAAFPLASGTGAVDSGTVQATNDAINAASGLWQGSTAAIKGSYYPRLLKIQCLSQVPTAGTVITFVDNNSVAIPGMAFTFAADAADKVRDFSFGGLVLPKGGFGVTITNTEIWQIVFTWSGV